MSEVRVVGATVVTCDSHMRVIAGGEVAWRDGSDRLSYVGPARGPAGPGDIDATGSVVMPGMVNGHTHSGMTPLRSYCDDLDFMSWLAQIREFEMLLTKEDLEWGLRLALVEMARTGTTAYADMFLWDEDLLDIARQAGLRIQVAPGNFGYDQVPYPAASDQDGHGAIAMTERLAADHAGDPFIHPIYALHAPYTCSAELIKDVTARALARDLPIHIHLSESVAEVQQWQAEHGCTPIEYVRRLGLFEARVHVAHAVNATQADIEILAAAGASVSHNPVSNLKLGAGIAPVPAMREAGVQLALGTDSVASNNSLDMFEEIKTGILIQRGLHQDAALTAGADYLAMATREGAAAIGFPDAGHLETGALADVVIVGTQAPHAVPLTGPEAFLCYAAQGSDVTDVFVGGRPVVRGGVMVTLNEQDVRTQVSDIPRRIVAQLADR